MNEAQSVEYWQKRWKEQGVAAVGHVGSTDEQQRLQTHQYGMAVVRGLAEGRSPDHRYERVLEVGCGWGRLVPYILTRTKSYQGVDIAAEAIACAASQFALMGHVGFRVIPVADLRLFPAQHFDAIVCCTVLQHIVDTGLLGRTVTEMQRVLAPGGRVVLLENCWDKPSKPHVAYRSPDAYRMLFHPIPFVELLRVTHRNEPHAVLVGDAPVGIGA